MEQIKDTIQALFKDWTEKGKLVIAEDIEALVGRVFSAEEAKHLRPRAVKGGVLALIVDSSTWLYYFNLHRRRLTDKLRAEAPGITEVKFSIGQVRQKHGTKKNSCNKTRK